MTGAASTSARTIGSIELLSNLAEGGARSSKFSQQLVLLGTPWLAAVFTCSRHFFTFSPTCEFVRSKRFLMKRNELEESTIHHNKIMAMISKTRTAEFTEELLAMQRELDAIIRERLQ